MVENPSDDCTFPDKKIPGIESLNVLRARLQMPVHHRWIAENEHVLKLRLRCAKLFGSPTLNTDTVDGLIGWLIEHGFTPDQARHMPLESVLKELDNPQQVPSSSTATPTNPDSRKVPEIRRLDDALTAATKRLSEALPRSMGDARLEGLTTSPEFVNWCHDARHVCAKVGLERSDYDLLMTSVEDHYRSVSAAITHAMTSEHDEWERLITATRPLIERLHRLEADIAGRMDFFRGATHGPFVNHVDIPLNASTIVNGQGVASYLDTLATSNTTMRNLVIRMGEKHTGQNHISIGHFPVANPIRSKTVMIRSRGEKTELHAVELETCLALCWARHIGSTETMRDPELHQWIIERQYPGSRLRLYKRNDNGYYFVLDIGTNQGLFLNETEYHLLRTTPGETTPAPEPQAENRGKGTSETPSGTLPTLPQFNSPESSISGSSPGTAFAFVWQETGYFITAFGESGFAPATKGFHDIAVILSEYQRNPTIEGVSLLMLDGQNISSADPRSKQRIHDYKYRQDIEAGLKRYDMEIEEARREGDEVAERDSQAKLNELQKQLVSDLGLRGTSKDMNNPFPKIANKIRNRINHAVAKLKNTTKLRKLAEHLELSLTASNTHYIYRPSPDNAPKWNVKIAGK